VVALYGSVEGEETELEVLRVGSGLPSLGELIRDEIEKLHSRLILDLYGLEKTDSIGIGEIVTQFVYARDSGGELVLANLRPGIREIFRYTGLDSRMPIYDSMAEAVRHFDF